MKLKDYKKLAFEMGMKGAKKYMCSPCLNPEFMEIVPNCDFGDDKGCRLRINMFKEYTRGWIVESLKEAI